MPLFAVLGRFQHVHGTVHQTAADRLGPAGVHAAQALPLLSTPGTPQIFYFLPGKPLGQQNDVVVQPVILVLGTLGAALGHGHIFRLRQLLPGAQVADPPQVVYQVAVRLGKISRFFPACVGRVHQKDIWLHEIGIHQLYKMPLGSFPVRPLLLLAGFPSGPASECVFPYRDQIHLGIYRAADDSFFPVAFLHFSFPFVEMLLPHTRPPSRPRLLASCSY